MAHHKRRRPKSQRNGCMCGGKIYKHGILAYRHRIKGRKWSVDLRDEGVIE